MRSRASGRSPGPVRRLKAGRLPNRGCRRDGDGDSPSHLGLHALPPLGGADAHATRHRRLFALPDLVTFIEMPGQRPPEGDSPN